MKYRNKAKWPNKKRLKSWSYTLVCYLENSQVARMLRAIVSPVPNGKLETQWLRYGKHNGKSQSGRHNGTGDTMARNTRTNFKSYLWPSDCPWNDSLWKRLIEISIFRTKFHKWFPRNSKPRLNNGLAPTPSLTRALSVSMALFSWHCIWAQSSPWPVAMTICSCCYGWNYVAFLVSCIHRRASRVFHELEHIMNNVFNVKHLKAILTIVILYYWVACKCFELHPSQSDAHYPRSPFFILLIGITNWIVVTWLKYQSITRYHAPKFFIILPYPKIIYHSNPPTKPPSIPHPLSSE